MEGGTFEIEATTGRKIGRICVSSFSVWTTVKRLPQHVWGWLTRQDNTSNEPEVKASITSSETEVKASITSNEPEVKASISYCGRVYYYDTFPHRKINFVITKDLRFVKHVRAQIYLVQSLITLYTVLVVLWNKSVRKSTVIVYVHAPGLHMYFIFLLILLLNPTP